MRKKKILSSLLLIISAFIINTGIVKADSTTLSVDEYITYGQKPNGSDYRTGLYSTTGYSGNAYCIMPGVEGVTGTFNTIDIDSDDFKNKAVSNMRSCDPTKSSCNPQYEYDDNQYKVYIFLLKYALYHGPGGPGYGNEPAVANDRYSDLIDTACEHIYEGGCKNDKQRYAVNHVMLSYMMSQYFGYNNVSDDSEWNANIRWATSASSGTAGICGGIAAFYG